MCGREWQQRYLPRIRSQLALSLIRWLCSLINHLTTVGEMRNYKSVVAKADVDTKR